MMIGISIGEEDRQTLTDVMRVAFTRYAPLMAAISGVIMLFAVPETRLFYKDASDPVTMRNMAEGDDAGKNIGLRMIFGILKDIEYQNLLGLNVLTMKI